MRIDQAAGGANAIFFSSVRLARRRGEALQFPIRRNGARGTARHTERFLTTNMTRALRPCRPSLCGRHREQPGPIANQTPGIHLPRRPRALAEEEIRGERRQGAHHETAFPPERDASDNRDGAHRLEIGNGREQNAARRGKSGQYHRGHDVAQTRARRLVAREEDAHARKHHDEREQRGLVEIRDGARRQYNRRGRNGDDFGRDASVNASAPACRAHYARSPSAAISPKRRLSAFGR